MHGRNVSLRISYLLAALFVLLACGQGYSPTIAEAQPGQGDEATVGFRWALGAWVEETGKEEKLEAIRQDTALKKGDRFKMLVELEKKCFVYVIHQSARGELRLIFPYSLQQFASNYDIGRKYYIPRGEGWFRLDENAGSETIHLLASAQRLEGVENLWSQYESAEAGHKPEIGKLFLAEIRKVKKQNREISARAERPVPIGGNIRGTSQGQEPEPFDVATIADGISANGLYARSFTIDYQ